MSETRQLILPPITDPSVHRQIDGLAQRYGRSAGPMMRAIGMLSRRAGNLTRHLPDGAVERLDRATRSALEQAWRAANLSRGVLRNRGDGFNRLAATLAGAAGGSVGIAGALAELPLTITLLTRAMIEIADEHGLDAASDAVRIECMHIFAAEGPMAVAEGRSAGLSSLGIPLAGQTAQTAIARAAPQLAAAFGQKLAVQSAPIVGALAGAAVNHAFASYYQNLARVHFGIIRLAQETGLPPEALAEALQQRIMRPD